MLISLQILRAVAAWVVVFHHYTQIFFDFKVDGVLGKAFAGLGAYGVDLFFVISGFVIYHSVHGKEVSPRVFLINRVARIVPAYWFFTLLTACLIVLWPNFYPNSSFDFSFLLKSLFFIPDKNPGGVGLYPVLTVGWTLNFEFFFYILFGISLWLGKSTRVWLVVGGIFLGYYLFPLLNPEFVFYNSSIIFEFLLGGFIFCIYKNHSIIQKIKILHAVFMIVFALAFLISGILLFGGGHSFFIVGIPAALVVVAVISQEARLGNLQIFSRLGDWSYSTYLCHTLVLLGMFQAYIKWGLNSTLALFISCIFVFLVSWLSYDFLEKRASGFIKRFI